ncbi:MAG: HPP family protein [Sulfuricaulis sp.]
MLLKKLVAALTHTSAPVSFTEKLVSAISAFLGILLTGILSSSLGHSATPLMIASMGASSVLLFAALHSPMAQPWSFVGGHLISAVIGVTCYKLIPGAFLGAAVAVALAIFAMQLTHCLHPPGGATALAMVISGHEVHALGYSAVLAPVGVNVLALLVIALYVNNMFPGRRYPIVSSTAPETKPPAAPVLSFGRVTLSKDDIESAVKEMDAYIDVTEEDLEQIYTRASLHHMRRQMGEIYCRDIMVRDVITAEYGDQLETVWETLRRRKLKGVPVIDRARRVIGMLTIMDFLKRADAHHDHPNLFGRLRGFIRRTPGLTAHKPEAVGQIMSAPAVTATEDMHIVSLIPLFTGHNIHHVPIVDRDRRLTGMVTQTDLSVALYRYWAAMP